MSVAAIQFPDLRFCQYCLAMYRLNRGVYNTIDTWLYDNGFHAVEARRALMLEFLEYRSQVEPIDGQSKFYKFGKGNLVDVLAQFVQRQSSISLAATS